MKDDPQGVVPSRVSSKHTWLIWNEKQCFIHGTTQIELYLSLSHLIAAVVRFVHASPSLQELDDFLRRLTRVRAPSKGSYFPQQNTKWPSVWWKHSKDNKQQLLHNLHSKRWKWIISTKSTTSISQQARYMYCLWTQWTHIYMLILDTMHAMKQTEAKK